jgi:AcrR family transcriptional regulator
MSSGVVQATARGPGGVAGPPGARRRGRPGHDLESVLATSVAVFTERGFDGTSIDDLSRRLGISKSAIYHHIDSKDALLGLALDRALAGLEEVAEQVGELDGPAVDRLEALLRASVRVLVERLEYVTLLLRVRGNSEVERQALARRRRLDRLAAALVAQAVREGDLRPDVDPAVTARLLFGMVNSLTEWFKPGTGQDAQTLAAAVAATAFDGLRVHR